VIETKTAHSVLHTSRWGQVGRMGQSGAAGVSRYLSFLGLGSEVTRGIIVCQHAGESRFVHAPGPSSARRTRRPQMEIEPGIVHCGDLEGQAFLSNFAHGQDAEIGQW
jgi:hypothetical protein